MKLFTIGYSGYEREQFLEALKAQGVNMVIDVRSLPASRYRPEYDKAAIGKYLLENGIDYCHMAWAFGARWEESRFIGAEGYVDFCLLSESDAFTRGVAKVVSLTEQGKSCALMCAEKDAMNCHRSILVARRFHEMGWKVLHLSPGRIEAHQELERRLLDLYFPYRFQISLLDEPRDEGELLKAAYRMQNEKIGFRKEE